MNINFLNKKTKNTREKISSENSLKFLEYTRKNDKRTT